ncbi:MAG: hypothetical protein V4603_05345, partial [Pseudomonadota bacterium]
TGSSLGLRTYKALYQESYRVDQAFAQASNTPPTTDFYAFLRDNTPQNSHKKRHRSTTASKENV